MTAKIRGMFFLKTCSILVCVSQNCWWKSSPTTTTDKEDRIYVPSWQGTPLAEILALQQIYIPSLINVCFNSADIMKL